MAYETLFMVYETVFMVYETVFKALYISKNLTGYNTLA